MDGPFEVNEKSCVTRDGAMRLRHNHSPDTKPANPHCPDTDPANPHRPDTVLPPHTSRSRHIRNYRHTYTLIDTPNYLTPILDDTPCAIKLIVTLSSQTFRAIISLKATLLLLLLFKNLKMLTNGARWIMFKPWRVMLTLLSQWLLIFCRWLSQ